MACCYAMCSASSSENTTHALSQVAAVRGGETEAGDAVVVPSSVSEPFSTTVEFFLINKNDAIPAAFALALDEAPAGARWLFSPSNGTVPPLQHAQITLALSMPHGSRSSLPTCLPWAAPR